VSLFEAPLKHFLRRDKDMMPDSRKKFAILDENSKVLLHLPPPSEREDLNRIVEFTIPKPTILSTYK
jgi:hypothetical protein